MAGSSRVEDEAFVTLATNDTYALGALVLANSLRNVGTTRQLVVMITAGVTQSLRHNLSQVFDLIKVVDVLDSGDSSNLDLLTRPDLGVTFTKLHCWRLTQYKKAVFMDADTMALQNIDELFEREELSAAPDAGWPDCFNSGVFVFRPSEETYQALLQCALEHGSFDGGDQGLLNIFFSDWATKDISKHLPFIYNVVSQAFYSYLPAFKQFGKDVKVVHFIGANKPWHQAYNTTQHTVTPQTGVGHNMGFLQQWWDIFMDRVNPHLSPGMDIHLNIYEEHHYHYEPYYDYHHEPQHDYHHHGNDDNSHTMVAPYAPPPVHAHYEAPPTSPTTHTVENKDDRQFGFFEAFFPEPPMSRSELYPDPYHNVYLAREFEGAMVDLGHQEVETDQTENFVEHCDSNTGNDYVNEETYTQSSVNDMQSNMDNTGENVVIEEQNEQWSHRNESERTSEQIPTSEQVPTSEHVSTTEQVPSSEHVQTSENDPESNFVPNTESVPISVEISIPPSVLSLATTSLPVSDVTSEVTSSEYMQTSTESLLDSESQQSIDDINESETSEIMVGFVEEVARLNITDSSATWSEAELDSRQRQYDWERGQIDYLGIDRFDNILQKLDKTINQSGATAGDSSF